MRGRNISEEHKRKISEANSKMKGENNSQFGSFWITNGFENKKLKNENDMPEGWYRGRKIK